MFRTNMHVLTIAISKPTIQRRRRITVIRASSSSRTARRIGKVGLESATLESSEVLTGFIGFHFRDVGIFST